MSIQGIRGAEGIREEQPGGEEIVTQPLPGHSANTEQEKREVHRS